MLVNAYCTHRRPPALQFPHELRARRDRSDPELAPHLSGFMGFVMAGGTRPMTAVRYGLLRHLERVQHHLAFEVDEAQLTELALWALEANAIVFVEDGTVRAPNGLVLVDPVTGEPEDGALVPYPLDAERRRDATRVSLEQRGLRTPPTLPAVISEVEVELRTADEIAGRCAALESCAVDARRPHALAMLRWAIGRSTAEILDELDLTFRLHWAIRDAQVNAKPPVPGVDPAAVMQRHHALNWLVRFEDADWDDVTTPT